MEWGAAVNRGYGVAGIRKDGRWVPIGIHRAVKEIRDGRSDLMVLHDCGNKLCFRADHTYFGTYQDNANDMFDMGESSGFAETHYGAKLSNQDVREIRDLYPASGMSQTHIAGLYGVNQGTISRIVRGEGRVRG